MDSKEYKKIIGRPKVLNYKTIHDTLVFLEHRNDLVDQLLELISTGKVPKPEKHNRRQAIETSYFYIQLEAPVKVEIFKEINSRVKFDSPELRKSTYADELATKWLKTIDEGRF